ncbi:MAG: hypothetical protein N2647_00365 [Thermodesulfovibrio sp.]|nr:hypothetical protein [Thermodesulfovibrio sp.]
MSKKSKLAIIIIVVSFIIPLFVSKISAPSFISSNEMRILDFQIPSYIVINEKKPTILASIYDPFKLSESFLKDSERKSSIFNVLMIYKGKNKYALVDNHIVKEGDKIGDFSVVKIQNDRVLIKDKKGEQIWLKLEIY